MFALGERFGPLASTFGWGPAAFCRYRLRTPLTRVYCRGIRGGRVLHGGSQPWHKAATARARARARLASSRRRGSFRPSSAACGSTRNFPRRGAVPGVLLRSRTARDRPLPKLNGSFLKMTKLNQIVAIEKGLQARAHEKLTEAYRQIGKAPLLSGISREYRPKDEDGDRLPGESTSVQVKVDDVLQQVAQELTRLFDVVATKDATNQLAKADLVVGDQVLAADLPISYLLWLERQLVGLHTFIKALPTHDPADDWTYSQGVWKTTPPVETVRTKKVPANHVKAWPTKEHPNIVPQVETYFEDVVVGYWKTVKFSGATPVDEAAKLLERVETLQRAVKFAREQANGTEVIDVKPGKAIFDYLFV